MAVISMLNNKNTDISFTQLFVGFDNQERSRIVKTRVVGGMEGVLAARDEGLYGQM